MATTYDKASLVMIPSGYKDDKLYSVKPTDGSGDFTFSRDGAGASPATRVNASGLIEKGRENLLLQSNNFDTTWVAANATLTSGQSGYDGSSDAWLFNASIITTDPRLQQTSLLSGVNTFSIYAKAGSVNWVALANPNDGAYFDLANGVVGSSVGTIIDKKITSVGGGWYKCSITMNTTSSLCQVYIASADNSVIVNAGDNIYIQDAQLEQGLVATAPAIETTTAVVSAGLLGDMPRLDYSGGATCPSLLLEPSRVNLVTQSEYFGTGTSWVKLNGSVTDNVSTSPEGQINAAKFIPDATSGVHALRSNLFNQSATSSHSWFVKANGYSKIAVRESELVGHYASFDISSGELISTDQTGTIEDYGNGWYRCTLIDTTTGVNAQTSIVVLPDSYTSGDPIFNWSGDGVKGVFAYGAQVEVGSYPTSYIPTYGSASTRGGDLSSVTGVSDLIGQTEGTLFVEADFNGVNHSVSQTPLFVRTAGSNTGYAFINFYQGKLNVGFRVAGSTLFDVLLGSTLSAGRYKIAFAYKSGDLVTYMNGSLIDTRTSTFGTTSYADVHLGGVSGNQLGDGHKQALLFKTRLTNAELAALTQI